LKQLNSREIKTISSLEVAEMIRREDARSIRNRKKKLISVEVDPDTYLAKEVLYLESILYRMSDQIRDIQRELHDIKKQSTNNADC
jgi:hypothetical protein